VKPYADRAAAGQVLAGELSAYAGATGLVVLGLPRGGVPVAAPVAAALGAPLDALVVRKIGLPGQPELAMGAVAGVGGDAAVVRNEAVIERAGVDGATFDRVLQQEAAELRRRELSYRGARPPAPVAGQMVIVLDDGLATGATMRAAVAALRHGRPARIVVAAPIGAVPTCAALAAEADEVVCPWTPSDFSSVGQGYRDFAPTSDEEVRRLLGVTA
jgi:predicted phosphoribosyltransferase